MLDTNIMKTISKDVEKGDGQKSHKNSIVSMYRLIRDNITVEPMLGGYIVSSVLTNLTNMNLYLEKACRVNLNYSSEVCDALTSRNTANYTHEERMVQGLVAGMSIWKTFLQSIIPASLILFVGSWSDRHARRKPCMLLPIFGEMMMCVGLILTTYFKRVPMQVGGLIEALFPAMMGGWFTMFMAVFSYIGNVASVETRTLRIGIVNIFCSVGIPIGTALTGVILKETGFYGVYSIALTLHTLSLLYGIFYLEELPIVVSENKSEISRTEKSVEKENVSFLKDLFDLAYIKETFRVVFKKGEYKRKKKVILIMILMVVVFGPMQGEMSVLYLFTRYKFNWDELDFSIFSTYSLVTNLFGTMFSVGVFSHLLKIDDAMVGCISTLSKIGAGFVYAFAATPFVFYLGAIVDIVNGTSFIAMRSIISKMVPPDELGKVNSLFGICEALVPLIYGPMYSAVYKATINTLPGTFFLIGGGLTAPATIIFFWMYREHKKEAKSRALQEELENRKLSQNNNNKELNIVTTDLNGNNNIENGDVQQKEWTSGVDNKAFESDDSNSNERDERQ